MSDQRGDLAGGRELAELRALVPAPADRPLPSGRHAIHREALMQQFTQDRPPSPARASRQRSRGQTARARRLVHAVLAAAVATAVAAGVILKVQQHPAPSAAPNSPGKSAQPLRLGGIGPTAAITLDAMARAATVTPPPAIGPHQWYYVKEEYKDTTWVALSQYWGYATNVSTYPDNPQPITAQSVQVEESWTGQQRSQGSLTRNPAGTVGAGWATPSPASAARPGIMNPTYTWLRSLPTDPRQLLKILYAQSLYLGGDRNVDAFSAIGHLLSSTVLPPATEAAIYRAAALIPGVTLIPETADMTGRTGFGIALTDSTGLQNEWIFSKATYEFLGERATQVTNAPGFVATDGGVGTKAGTSFPGAKPGTWILPPGTYVPGPKTGTLLAETAIVARGAAGSLGGKPTLFP
jgi:hypothetical protein